MQTLIPCPQCGTKYALTDQLRGKLVRCRNCKNTFTMQPPEPEVPVLTLADPEEEPLDCTFGDEDNPLDSMRADQLRTEPATPRERRRETRSPSPYDDRDDDRDRGNHRFANRDRESHPRGSSVALWLVAAGAGMLVLLVGGVGAYFLLDRTPKKTPTRQAQADPRPERTVPPPRRIALPRQAKNPPRAVQPEPPEPPEEPMVEESPFELPPLPPALEITPTPIDDETTYRLPQPVDQLCVGGGGRFLILHFRRLRTCGIFDVNERKIVRYIPTGEDDVSIAAGMTELVVYQPGADLLLRYDLLTGQREALQKIDYRGKTVTAFCMGHASAGPLLISATGKYPVTELFDLETLEPMLLPYVEQGRFHREPRRMTLRSGRYWAGANGRAFGYRGSYSSTTMLHLSDGKVRYRGETRGGWFVVPGPNDRYAYVGGYGVVSLDLAKVPNVPFSLGKSSGYAYNMYLPAHHGPYYFHAATIKSHHQGQTLSPGTLSIFVMGYSDSILEFADTNVASYNSKGIAHVGFERSMHLIPKAKLLLVLSETRDELRLYPVDVEQALTNLGRDFFVFTSTPPRRFEKGQTLEYQIEARTNNDPGEFRLESGPKGMTVSASGKLKWEVPKTFAEDRVDVILAGKDAKGGSHFQTFTLTPKE